MRIIGQGGTIDIPYEFSVLQVGYWDLSKEEMVETNTINLVTGTNNFKTMAVYETKARALEVMKGIRDVWLNQSKKSGVIEDEWGYTFDVKLNRGNIVFYMPEE